MKINTEGTIEDEIPNLKERIDKLDKLVHNNIFYHNLLSSKFVREMSRLKETDRKKIGVYISDSENKIIQQQNTLKLESTWTFNSIKEAENFDIEKDETYNKYMDILNKPRSRMGRLYNGVTRGIGRMRNRVTNGIGRMRNRVTRGIGRMRNRFKRSRKSGNEPRTATNLNQEISLKNTDTSQSLKQTMKSFSNNQSIVNSK